MVSSGGVTANNDSIVRRGDDRRRDFREWLSGVARIIRVLN
jgi:hypothetical protein